MKVATVGILAGVGMALTSMSVWSLTKPRTDLEKRATGTELPEPTKTNPPIGPTKSEFKAGTTLTVEGRLGHARLFAEEPNQTYLFLDVRAESNGAASAPPLNLAIVIDRSGSMKGKRLENALTAARGMISRLRDGDIASVITYSNATETVLAPTRMDSSSRERALASLGRIEPRGDTCISCGIDAGMAALRQNSGMVTRMLLLTDGEATAGVKDIDGFRRIATSARSSGVTVSSIGVDVDYNERVLSALALESNGMHHFAENASSLPAIFDRELSTLKGTVATGAELEIDLAPGIEVEQVFDRPFRRDGNRLFVTVGDFAGGEQKTLLARVRVPTGTPGDRAIADVRLAYRDLVKQAPGNCFGTLATQLVNEKSLVSPLDGLVSARIGRSETAAVLNEANDLFRNGDTAKATEKLEQAKARITTRAQAAASAAPAARSSELEGDLKSQSSSLDKAKDNLEKAANAPRPSPKAPPPQQSRDGKSGLKQNQDLANPFQR